MEDVTPQPHYPRPTRPGYGEGSRPIERYGGDSALHLVVLIVLVTAIGAALASPSATAYADLNIALRVVLGAGIATIATTTPWGFLTLAAGLCVLGTEGEALMLVPTVCVLFAIAAWVGEHRRPHLADRRYNWHKPAKATIGGLTVQLAFRFHWPDLALSTAALAGSAVVAILLPGVITLSRRLREVTISILAAGLLACLLLALVGGLAAIRARSAIEAGIAHIEAGLHATTQGNQASAHSAFAAAHFDFTAALNQLRWDRCAEVVPGFSQQLHAVNAAVSIGNTLSLAATVTQAELTHLHFIDGTFPVNALVSMRPLFAADLSTIKLSLMQARLFESPWILTPLRAKLHREVVQLHAAERFAIIASHAANSVPQMLGEHQTKRYLVLFENPAESRASGGIVGDYAILSAYHGHLSLKHIGSVDRLNMGGNVGLRRLEAPYSYRIQYARFEPQFYWQNVPMSPDFPSVGIVAANLYPQSGGSKVDGVISVDPVALADLLAVTGPVSAPEWPIPLTSSNAVAVLANREFVHFADDEASQGSYIREIIRLLWHKLSRQRLSSISVLARTLSSAVGGHHLLLFSTSHRVETFLKEIHLAGAMPSATRDFLEVVTQNADGNKIDWYLRRTIEYRVALNRETHLLTATLTVLLDNLSPHAGLPRYIIGHAPGVRLQPGESELYVSIYSPWLASTADVNGKTAQISRQRAFGRYVYSLFVEIPSHHVTQLVVRLHGHWYSRHRYRFTYDHQPLLFQDRLITSLRQF